MQYKNKKGMLNLQFYVKYDITIGDELIWSPFHHVGKINFRQGNCPRRNYYGKH